MRTKEGAGYQYAKRYKPSQFKYVHMTKPPAGDEWFWRLSYPGYHSRRYKTEREAAIAVDKILIGLGKEPINILKRKAA